MEEQRNEQLEEEMTAPAENCSGESEADEPKVSVCEETMEDYKEELEASFKKVKEGDMLTGVIIGVTEDEVILDLKYYTEGIIKKEHFSNDPECLLKETAVPGEEVTAKVISTDDGDGHIVLSRKEANDIIAWDKLEQYMTERTILSLKVGGVVKGGVIAYVEGIRGFIPASKVSASYVENLEEFLGKEIEAQVITADREEKRLVLSAKEVALAKLADEKNKRIAKCEVGAVVEGTVDSIKKYGAFIHLDNGLSGLLHISQISDKRLKSPAAVLAEGDRVTVKIISTADNKLSFSMKALLDVAQAETEEEPVEYKEEGQASTSLGSLLKGFHFE